MKNALYEMLKDVLQRQLVQSSRPISSRQKKIERRMNQGRYPPRTHKVKAAEIMSAVVPGFMRLPSLLSFASNFSFSFLPSAVSMPPACRMLTAYKENSSAV